MEIINHRGNFSSIKDFDATMRTKQATNVVLADIVGVSTKTIQKLRDGKPIRSYLAECAMEALSEGTFKYLTRGRKKKSA